MKIVASKLCYFLSLKAFAFFLMTVSAYSAYGQVPTSGRLIWLKASDIALNNGDSVSNWPATLGTTVSASSSGIYRPIFQTNRIAGKPAVSFRGNGKTTKDQPLMLANITTNQDVTAFAVLANMTQNLETDRVDVLMGTKENWPRRGFSISTYNSYATTLKRAIYREIGDNSGGSGNDGDVRIWKNGKELSNFAENIINYNEFFVLSFELKNVTNTGQSGAPLIIGGFRDSTRCGSNDIAELLIYNRPLSDNERIQVESYLSQRYNLAQDTSAAPSVQLGQTGTFVLGNTGAVVSFTTASSNTGSLSASVTNERPTIVGSLPTGIVNIANRYWTITQSNLTGFTYAITFDLSTLAGVQNFNNLKVLKRDNSSSPWVNVETLSGVSILRNEPFITVTGLTSFSDFTIGSDASNSLPVELVSFTGSRTNEGVQLRWKTASEQNNAGFEVERKDDGSTWLTLGFVRGAGTTTETQSYTFLDRSASGKVHYRLKQIDFDGQFEYSNVIEVDAALPETFVLEQNYPNPFNPTTVIAYQLPVTSMVSLKVYDMLGREVAILINKQQQAGRYAYTLNALNWASGVYFYRLQAGNFVQSKKMLLLK
jgi:hypothetical protein